MVARQLIKLIKAYRGPVIVEVNNFNDTFWVQAVKSDLLLQLGKFQADQETGFELDRNGILTKDYSTAWR